MASVNTRIKEALEVLCARESYIELIGKRFSFIAETHNTLDALAGTVGSISIDAMTENQPYIKEDSVEIVVNPVIVRANSHYKLHPLNCLYIKGEYYPARPELTGWQLCTSWDLDSDSIDGQVTFYG